MTGFNWKKMNAAMFKLLSVVVILALPVQAQLPELFENDRTKPAENAGPDIRTQLKVWESETKAALLDLQKITTGAGLPDGITAADLSTRRRHLEQTQLAITRHLIILDGVKTAADELARIRIEKDGWKGFDTPGPYSVLLVDQLQNRRQAVEEKAASYRSSLGVFKDTLDLLFAEYKAGEENVNQATTPPATDNQATFWRLGTARFKQRNLFIRASALQQNIASHEDLEKAAEIELDLLSKQITEARKNTVFDNEDLEKIKKASLDRQAGLREEVSAIRKRQSSALEARSKLAADLEIIRAAVPTDSDAIELAELQLKSIDASMEALQMMVDSLESYDQIEAFVPEAYEHRRALMKAENFSERNEALSSLIALNQRLNTWEVVAKNELSSVAADLAKHQSQTAMLSANDPKLVPLNGLGAVLWEKQALIQRASQSITNQRNTLSRWIEDHTIKQETGWYAGVKQSAKRGWEAIERIWHIPVTKYEKTIEFDGKREVQTHFVTLGAILLAIIVFITAYLIAARISRRFQRVLVHRKVIGENQAKTLRNWLMLVVALLLALATLSWLSIPLTIFAFLAGALAIGLGFGTQTIIKNFISGIILLFERKVRVGDIIEVDDTMGVVTEINTRSSIVRGFNGVESLIPNSLFIENRVVNWTLNSRFLRREINLGVSYGSPTDKVIEILSAAADRHGLVLKDPPPYATFAKFGENSLDFVLYFWIELNDRTNGLIVDSDLRIIIEKCLTEEKIGVPFPQRDIHLTTESPVRIEMVKTMETE
ncbi:MAG: mechanosensitive ion channel [Armatimonadetes bacterium]|nr:mechanosensitive ion channel [Akkermansiaceae bacterium]